MHGSRFNRKQIGFAGGSLVVVSCIVLAAFFFRYHPKPELQFIDVERRVQGELYLRFRLINAGRYDHHYQIRTEPSLVRQGQAAAMGLLGAGSVITNRIPVDFADQPFRLIVDCYRIPILPNGWYRKPRHAWSCLRDFSRGESRLLYSYPDELLKDRVYQARTPMVTVEGPRTDDSVAPVAP